MEGELDYKKIGLKCGLEIHQQLNTEKLFCNCPSVLRKDNPDFVVMRNLHAIAGESGEIDKAVKYHASLERDFFYQGYNGTTCLVELDESPPREINVDVLMIAVQISLLLNAKIFPITQIMRKTVVDGSNTSGFQRTVLVAHDGFIETSFGRVGIDSVCLEEDSARIIEAREGKAVYRLDRLGIPLIEIATAPDIKNPSQAREVALHLGKILRSCNVKRGLGTIRQDVNISVKGGKRVEIKGVQDPDLIKKSVEMEARRQIGMIKSKKDFDSEVRKVLLNGETEFLRPMPGAARMYPETDLPLLKISRDFVNEVKKTLPKIRHDIEGDLKKKGLSQELTRLVLGGYLEDFERLLKIYPKDPELIAKMLTVWRKELSTKLGKKMEDIEEAIDIASIKKILAEFEKGKIDESYVKGVMNDVSKGVSLEKAIKREEADLEKMEEKIMNIIKGKPGLSENAYMGLAMKEFKGKVSGKEVMEIIKKYA